MAYSQCHFEARRSRPSPSKQARPPSTKLDVSRSTSVRWDQALHCRPLAPSASSERPLFVNSSTVPLKSASQLKALPNITVRIKPGSAPTVALYPKIGWYRHHECQAIRHRRALPQLAVSQAARCGNCHRRCADYFRKSKTCLEVLYDQPLRRSDIKPE
jgi:hypothetical protein